MLAPVLALALVSQVAADGLTIDPNLPRDLTTWRWTAHQGKAALGWGRLNDQNQFVAVSPRPRLPLYPEAEPSPIEGVPAFAVNGVVSDKLDGGGLILRASDPDTAEAAKQAFFETSSTEGRLKPLFLPLKIGPDWSVIGLYAIAASLFVLSGVMLLRSRQRPYPRE